MKLELDLEDDEVRRLFFDANGTCYLNGYLLSNGNKGKKRRRTLPVPRSWFKEKDAQLNEESQEIRAFDFAIDRNDDLKSPKFVGESFWREERGSVKLYKEKRRMNIHNTRDRKKGRSTQVKRDPKTNQLQGEGDIFRYEAINRGQSFQVVITCSNDADANLLKNLLEKSEDIWLGGSQTAGYGHTKISKDISVVDLKNWDEVDVCAEE